MITAQYSDLASMYMKTVDAFILNKPGVIDKAWSPRAFSFNNFLRARSAEMPFDFAWVGLTRARWARFLHMYVERDDLVEFMDKVSQLRRGAEVGLYTRRDTDHAWGSCLMGVTFGAIPDAHISVFSRTSSFAQTGIVDLAFAHIMAREVGRISNIPTSQISINWYVSSLFLSALHIIPYLTSTKRIDEVIATAHTDKDNKFCGFVNSIYQRYFVERRITKYGPTNRMIARHDSINAETLKSTTIDSLDLSPVLNWRGRPGQLPELEPDELDEFVTELEEVI